MNIPSKRLENLALVFAGITFSYAILTVIIGRFWAGSIFLLTILVPLGVAFTYCLIAWWYCRLSRQVAEEHLQQQRSDDAGSHDRLFERDELPSSPVAESLRVYHRRFLPACIIGVSLLILGYLVNYEELTNIVAKEREALGVAGFSAFIFVFSLLSGSYLNGLSRESAVNRWMRPVAGWHYLSCAGFFLAAVIFLAEHLGWGHWHTTAFTIFAGALALLAVELLINVLIECYRPRLKGVVERPLHESRLLSLVIEPGGIAKNVARTLDYQFGFTLSESWFYRFIERSCTPYLLLLLVSLYALDSIVVIDTTELGIRERFGKPVSQTPLQPGLHFKFPAPVDRIITYPGKSIQSVTVGYSQSEHDDFDSVAPDDDDQIILWTNSHLHSENDFLVAVDPAKSADSTTTDHAANRSRSQIVPVNLLSASIPVFFRIDESMLFRFAYGYSELQTIVANIASQETVQYFATVDFIDMIGYRRLEAKSELEQRIRTAVTNQNPALGIEILFVGLMEVHPSSQVAAAFQELTVAEEIRSQKIVEAKSYADKEVVIAKGRAESLFLEAEAYQDSRKLEAESVTSRFEEQLTAYAIAPSVYKLRHYLDLLDAAFPKIRKYVVASSSSEVLIFDMKERLRPDLLEDFNFEHE